MNKKGIISHGQVAFLAYASAAGNIVYTFNYITTVAGRTFWVAILVGVLLNVPLVIWTLYLGSFRKEGTVFDLLENGLGKIISKIILLAYLAVNVAVAVCMLNLITGTVKEYFLQKTPAFVIMLFMVLICTMFVSSGISTFARLIEILVFLFTLNYFTGFFLSFASIFKIEYVIPVFDTTIGQFAKAVLITTGSISECVLFFMMSVGSIPQTSKHYLSAVKGLTVWAVILAFAIIIMEGDVSNELLSRVALAGVTVSAVIQIQSFIRGLEVLILMTYQYIAVAKITIDIYSCHEALKKLFNAQKGTLLLAASGLLVLTASIYVNSLNAGYYYAVFLGSYVILPAVLFILVLASISYAVVKRKNRND